MSFLCNFVLLAQITDLFPPPNNGNRALTGDYFAEVMQYVFTLNNIPIKYWIYALVLLQGLTVGMLMFNSLRDGVRIWKRK